MILGTPQPLHVVLFKSRALLAVTSQSQKSPTGLHPHFATLRQSQRIFFSQTLTNFLNISQQIIEAFFEHKVEAHEQMLDQWKNAVG